MSDLTITLEGSEVRADFFGTNAWLRNDGTSTIYAGRKPGVVIGADGVVSVPAGGSAPVFDAHGTVYIIGTGSVQLIGSDYSNNPFKTSAQGGSGADEVARAAIEAHAGNSAIHLTAEQLNAAVNEATEGGKTVEKASAYTIDNSVDYPIVDMRIYGKSTQKQYSGKNLLNYNAWKDVITTNGTAVFENNGITLTATQNDCYTSFAGGFPEAAKIPIKEGETITLSWQETDNKEGMVIIFPNGSTETTGRVVINNKSGKTLSYTATAGISFVTFRFGVANSGDTIRYKNIQIEKGSTATSYEPYVGGVSSPNPDYPQDIVSVGDSGAVAVAACGKNLINIQKPEIISSSVQNGIESATFELENNGMTLKSGTANAKWAANRWFWRIRKGTYAFSCKMSCDDETFTPSLGMYFKKHIDDAPTSFGALIPTKLTKVYTLQEDGYLGLYFHLTDDNGITAASRTVRYYDIQIELSDTVTDYGPYKGSTASLTSALPLCGIPVDADGNYTDSNGQQWICDELIYNADGTGKIVKNTIEMTFDGSTDEKWAPSGISIKNKSRFVLEDGLEKVLRPAKISEEIVPIICNSFLSNSASDSWKGKDGISINIRGGIYIYKETFATYTIDEWNSWLADNPITIVGVLNTPQEINLTAEEMSQLQSLQTFDGITNISNDKGAEMRVKYCTNRALSEYEKPVIDGLKKQINELKTAVLSLGGNV